MIKHIHGPTLIDYGKGTVLMFAGLNEVGHGLLNLYSTEHPHRIGGMRTFEEADIPSDVDLEQPDVILRFENVKGLDALIETLHRVKELMTEATNDEV